MEENIQLRWLQKPAKDADVLGSPFDAPTLQYRVIQSVRHKVQWSEWKDVPTVQE